jgi:hypothetical protein
MIKNFLALYVPEGLLPCLVADQKPFVPTEYVRGWLATTVGQDAYEKGKIS